MVAKCRGKNADCETTNSAQIEGARTGREKISRLCSNARAEREDLRAMKERREESNNAYSRASLNLLAMFSAERMPFRLQVHPHALQRLLFDNAQRCEHFDTGLPSPSRLLRYRRKAATGARFALAVPAHGFPQRGTRAGSASRSP